MNDHSPDEMNPDQQRLDALLARYTSQPITPVPGDLESRVWREIRVRRSGESQSSEGGSWLAIVIGLWRQPGVAFVGVVAAAAVGIGMSWASTTTGKAASTREALDLGVFTMESPSLPSTLLASAESVP